MKYDCHCRAHRRIDSPVRFIPSRTRARRATQFAWAWVTLLGWELCGAPEVAELGRPLLRNFTPGEHLRGRSSPTMAQDTVGTIWFANTPGLLGYDGVRYRVVPLPTESAGVRQFATTADGTIFMGGAGVLGYLRGAGQDAVFVSLVDRIPPEARNVDEIRWAAASGQTVYFSDEQKILIWREGRMTVLPYPTAAHSRGARLHSVGGSIYVTALERPLSRFVDDRLEIVADDPVLRQNHVVAVEPGASAGELLLLTSERGYFRVSGGRVAPHETPANRWLAGKRVYRARVLADGSRVVAFSSVSGDGGVRFDAAGRYLGPLDVTIGLVVKTVRDFFTDREGGLWIGLETGAARLEWPSAVTLFDVVNGLGQGAVTDLVRHEGVLHAATEEGLFRLVPAEEGGRAARFERVLNQPVFALVSHPAGLVALGYSEVFVAQQGARMVSVARLPPGGGALLRSKRDPARIWIGTTQGIHSLTSAPGRWRHEDAIPGFEDSCRALVEADSGGLWVATERGFAFLPPSDREHPVATAAAERFTGGAGLPDRIGRANLAEWDGAPVFLVDASSRPYRFDATRRGFVPISGTENLAAESKETGRDSADAPVGGDRWLAGAAIHHVPASGVAPRRLPHFALATVGRVSRLVEEQRGGETVLWVGGARGLARVEVARAFIGPVPFTTQLSATGVRDGDALPTEHVPITFDYLAARQRPTNTVTYQSRLLGREREWSPWEEKRERSFPHLPPGRYRFEVRARDADGELSATVGIGFVVTAPWWRTGWAVAGYAVSLMAVIGGIVRLRTRALRDRAARLEKIVAERTQELGQRTTELANMNRELVRLNRLESEEKIAARLAEEKARLEVLRYQLNPHFLYNTLASISASLPAAATTGRSMLERLADFCRLTLHRPEGRDWTTLGEEVRLVRAYLEIEKSRWGELLEVEIAIAPGLDHEQLPHFLLLPLVENALKYGRATSPDRVGLRLSARLDGAAALVLEVANTGAWIEPRAAKTVFTLGIGLDNLRERLARYYPQAHALTLTEREGWVAAELRLVRDAKAESGARDEIPRPS